MSSDPTIERMLARYEPKRREALRKILLGVAVYTAPVVASYSLQSLGGEAQAQTLCSNQTLSNCNVPIPVDSAFALAAAAGAVGAAGAFMLRRRRAKKDDGAK